jgi:hypothetical protein
VRIYDLHGRMVATLLEEELTAGDHRFTWNAEGLPVGIYFFRITSEEGTFNQKIVLQ